MNFILTFVYQDSLFFDHVKIYVDSDEEEFIKKEVIKYLDGVDGNIGAKEAVDIKTWTRSTVISRRWKINKNDYQF